MSRGWYGLAVVPMMLMALAVGATGCDVSAHAFAGSVIQMSLAGAAPLPAGQHFELWSRNQYNDVIRVGQNYDVPDPKNANNNLHQEPFGLEIRSVIRMDDPCMIDDSGNLLVTAAAYPKTTVINGITQSPEEQAAQVRQRIGQLTTAQVCDATVTLNAGTPEGNPLSHCGRINTNLLGVFPYELIAGDGTPLPTPTSPTTCETSGNAAGCIPWLAAPMARLAACRAYWDSSTLAYTPNPAQITAPAHGTIWGTIAFNTQTPPASYDDITIYSPENLKGSQELWLTTEPDKVDPVNRGSVYVQGVPDTGGLSWIHLALAPPFGSALAVSGTAAVLADLDQDPVQF